ncbi:hypothetical protein BHE74_00054202 [Ensete ventricosum]|nr:hypothetical protein BHE74_00054202 [Ensete ventricosum]
MRGPGTIPTRQNGAHPVPLSLPYQVDTHRIHRAVVIHRQSGPAKPPPCTWSPLESLNAADKLQAGAHPLTHLPFPPMTAPRPSQE